MDRAEHLIAHELEQLAPRDEIREPDWADVRRRSARGVTSRQWALAIVVALAGTTAAVLALSASARELLGLDRAPTPDYAHAHLVVSAAVPPGRVARLWVAPSTDGGECAFVTVDPGGSRPVPKQKHFGGGMCTLGKARIAGRLSWSFSHGDPPIINGHVGSSVRAHRVVLHWHGGSQRLALRDGFFLAAAAGLKDPPFRQLPYDIIVLDAKGRQVARSRIPESFLYTAWKSVRHDLHRYRVAHGCKLVLGGSQSPGSGAVALWRCASR